MTWNPREGQQPLISLVLATKNALPHLEAAVDALKRQTYKNFELLVQDGGSIDGTLEYLSSLAGLVTVKVVSEPDDGIGQAYNRGLRRCSGDLVCLVSSDEYLDDDALERAVGWFVKYPEAAIIYGGIRLVNGNAHITQVFVPPAFELFGVLRNEIIPPIAAAFLNRRKIGEGLYYDESLRTCPDYDFWLRQGSKFTPSEIINVGEVLLTARADRASMTYRAEAYDQLSRDKLLILNRFLDSQSQGSLIESLRRTASAGIYTWAAEAVFQLEGVSPSFLKWCNEAAKLQPPAERLHRLALRSRKIAINQVTGEISLKQNVQPDCPFSQTTQADGFINVMTINPTEVWRIVRTAANGRTIKVMAGPSAWAHAAEIPLLLPERLDRKSWYWIRLSCRVLQGQVGIGILVAGELLNERLIEAGSQCVETFVVLDHADAKAVIIRNGSFESPSVVELSDVSVECCPKNFELQYSSREPNQM